MLDSLNKQLKMMQKHEQAVAKQMSTGFAQRMNAYAAES